MVGLDLDKALPLGVLCAFSGLLFSRAGVVCVFIPAGRPFSPCSVRIHSHHARFMIQTYIVCTITTVFTAFSSFGLAAVSTWFASERWVFARHKGKKWLQDSLDDFWDAAMSIPPFQQFVECLHSLGLWTSWISHRTRAAARHVSSAIASVIHHPFVDVLHSSSSENSLSSSPAPEAAGSTSQGSRRGSEVTFAPPTTEIRSRQASTASFTLSSASEMPSGVTSTPTSPSPSRVRFVQTVRNVIRMQQASSFRSQFSRSLTPTLLTPDGIHQKDNQPMPVQSSRVASLVPKLRGLKLTQDLDAHQALVRHLQFSPNGKFLATSRFVSYSSSSV
jgi:hypothetical protein